MVSSSFMTGMDINHLTSSGATDDAIRSLVISSMLLGTEEFLVVHHTDCGMLTFTDADIRTKLRDNLKADADHVAFLPFGDRQFRAQ